MGLSLGSLLSTVARGVVGALPIPGANIAAGLIPSGGKNSPYVPDFIEGLYNPAVNQPVQPQVANCAQIPVTMQPMIRQIHAAPSGYVIVDCRGQKVAMLKPVARALGLWKPRKKPPIKVSDWQALMKADRTIRKLNTVRKRAGMVDRARGRKPSTTTTRRKR